MRQFMSAVGIASAAVLLMVGASGAGATAGHVASARSTEAQTVERGLAWRAVVAGPNVPPLLAVLALSPTDVWAVGGSSWLADAKPVIVHWNGTTLRRFPAFRPKIRPIEAALTAIAGVSSRDIWAVGFDGDYRISGRPIAMHWDGRAWKSAALPTIAGSARLTGVAAFAANDVWAVGNIGGLTGHALVLHWNGTRWKVVDLGREAPRETELEAIDGTSPSDVWAVGGRNIDQRLYMIENYALHWDGHRWKEEQRWDSEGSGNAVDARTPGDVWSLSDISSGAATHVLRWNGARQRLTRENYELFLSDVASVAPTSVWAVGELVEHWDGRRWTDSTPSFLKTSCPTCDPPALTGLSALSPTDVWASGTKVLARYSR